MTIETFYESIKSIYSLSEVKIIYRLLKDYNINFKTALDRLLLNEPIDHIIGTSEFYGLKFLVTNHTLIPRPETEELVELVLKQMGHKSGLKILEIGTGSGCIAISLAKNLVKAQICALDISEDALKIAKKNALAHQVDIQWILTDFLDSNEWNLQDKYDIIVSNPPYIPLLEAETMQENVLKYEPHQALFVPNEDALIFYRKIFEFSEKHLKPSGRIYCETSQNIQYVTHKGFKIDSLKDYSNNLRFIIGHRN